MKKVLLLGDSIRMGYDEYVLDLMRGEAEVLFDEDNGRFAAYTLWQANQMMRRFGPFDAVHWNNGYWDMNVEAPMTEAIHPVEEYLHFLRRILRLCREGGARVVFATTTPILEPGHALGTGGTGMPISYSDDWVLRYNAAAKALMEAEGVPVNDLYALCKRDKDYFKCSDRLHLTEEGYRACAAQAAQCIRACWEREL